MNFKQNILNRRIGDNLHETIPNLETLVLTNNMIQDLAEIDNLCELKELKHLSLLFNPISTKEHYRPYIIFRLPQLKVLDFRKIKLKVNLNFEAFLVCLIQLNGLVNYEYLIVN